MLSPKKITHEKSWKNGYSEAQEFRVPTARQPAVPALAAGVSDVSRRRGHINLAMTWWTLEGTKQTLLPSSSIKPIPLTALAPQ